MAQTSDLGSSISAMLLSQSPDVTTDEQIVYTGWPPGCYIQTLAIATNPVFSDLDPPLTEADRKTQCWLYRVKLQVGGSSCIKFVSYSYDHAQSSIPILLYSPWGKNRIPGHLQVKSSQ